jgi:hypothetical protein
MSSIDEPNFDGEAPLPEESNNNRTFMIAVGILGGIILISVACLVGVYLFGRTRTTGTQKTQSANSTATAAAFISNALTATSQGLLSLPTTTSTPVPTSVVKAATNTSTVDPSVAGAAGTPAAATAGLPGLVVMALAFVIVILLARRLRTAPTLNR